MAFNKMELEHIDRTVGAFVRRRQPPEHLLDKLRHDVEIDGHKVRIWTIRPHWQDPTEEIRSAVAQFTYIRTEDRWKLYWMRRDMKWHVWPPAAHIERLEDLVAVVDEDAHGGFWG